MIDKAKLIELQNWFELRSHRERIALLILGWACIYLFWYLLFSRPLQLEIKEIKDEIVSVKDQILSSQQAAKNILLDTSKKQTNMAIQIDNKPKPLGVAAVKYAVMQDSSELIQELLKKQTALQITNLKNLPVPIGTGKIAAGFEITFKSNYFATLAYLHSIEKLPWCLSWDSLEYKVTNYPDANVVITLHELNS